MKTPSEIDRLRERERGPRYWMVRSQARDMLWPLFSFHRNHAPSAGMLRLCHMLQEDLSRRLMLAS